MQITGPISGYADTCAVELPAVPPPTKSRTYRLPIDLWERVCKLQERRQAEVRAHAPEHLRDAVQISETDVVVELLRRGLESVDAEAKPNRRRR